MSISGLWFSDISGAQPVKCRKDHWNKKKLRHNQETTQGKPELSQWLTTNGIW